MSDKITPEDIESKFREFSGEVEETGDAARNTVFMVAAGVGLVVLAGVFLAGRNRGKKKSTVVEIRRI